MFVLIKGRLNLHSQSIQVDRLVTLTYLDATRSHRIYFQFIQYPNQVSLITGCLTVGSGEDKTGVMVRSITTRDEDLKTEVRRQVEMFHRVAHTNLAGVIGVVGDSPQLILIYSHNLHNLKLHLQV